MASTRMWGSLPKMNVKHLPQVRLVCEGIAHDIKSDAGGKQSTEHAESCPLAWTL